MAEILRYIDEWGFAPSQRDVAAAIGLSLSSVHAAFQALSKAGRIRVHPSIPRGVVVLK